MQQQGIGDPQQPQAPLRWYALWDSQREDGDDTMAAFDRMGLKHPDACRLLNRVIDYDEVNAALLKLKDVGAGPDNLSPNCIVRSCRPWTPMPGYSSIGERF